MRLIISFVVMSCIVGCTSVKNNYMPEYVNISEPPLGSVNVKGVGDELLKQGKYREHDAIKVSYPTYIGYWQTVYPGYFLKIGEDIENIYYRVGGVRDQSGFIQRDGVSSRIERLMIKKTSQILCGILSETQVLCESNPTINFEYTKVQIVSENAMQQTLIYNGRVGNKINVGYREYLGDFARSAFSNSVEYDLSESNRIGYKGALIEVMDATNQNIKYRVISNFNSAER